MWVSKLGTQLHWSMSTFPIYSVANWGAISHMGAGDLEVSMHLSMPQSFGLYAGALMESGGFSGWTAQSMLRKERWFQRLMDQTQRLADEAERLEGMDSSGCPFSGHAAQLMHLQVPFAAHMIRRCNVCHSYPFIVDDFPLYRWAFFHRKVDMFQPLTLRCQDLDCLLKLPTEELFSAYLAIPQGRQWTKLIMCSSC